MWLEIFHVKCNVLQHNYRCFRFLILWHFHLTTLHKIIKCSQVIRNNISLASLVWWYSRVLAFKGDTSLICDNQKTTYWCVLEFNTLIYHSFLYWNIDYHLFLIFSFFSLYAASPFTSLFCSAMQNSYLAPVPFGSHNLENMLDVPQLTCYYKATKECMV